MNALGRIPFLLLPIPIHDHHFEIFFICYLIKFSFPFSSLTDEIPESKIPTTQKFYVLLPERLEVYYMN